MYYIGVEMLLVLQFDGNWNNFINKYVNPLIRRLEYENTECSYAE
jgi:hypothetical protein